MSTAILVTYRDMETNVLTEFIAKAKTKYAGRFTQLYFDNGALKGQLLAAVKKVSDQEKLKVFISGHGNAGIPYITDDAKVRRQTLDDLAGLLRVALRERAASPNNSQNTEVNMISCLFGRTPDGGVESISAVQLHRKLATWHVYVDLIARTESILNFPEGRKTISLLKDEIDVPDYGRLPYFYQRKTHFSKIRCTYQNRAPLVLIKDYSPEDNPHINAQDPAGQRLLWADNVVNELVKYIKPPQGKTGVTDDRKTKIYTLVTAYDSRRSPENLKTSLESLLAQISSHRDPGWKLLPEFLTPLPDTAKLVKKLLEAYPG